MKLKKHIHILLLIAIVLAGSVFLITRFSIDNNKHSAYSLERVFSTTDELVKNSDAIVVGVIEKIHKPKVRPVETDSDIPVEKIVVRIDVKLDKSFKGTFSK
ncbi:hypothetical protein [Brassicibacter mesophilus]|uniref:hypothetical protein n=1 Tax=Brassicibacter mesophilus TaxID=745119 RepID=UPI003D1B3D0A